MAATSTDAAPLPPSPLPMPFEDFPEDVQLAVLSFLTPTDISSFASTSRRSASLCVQPKLWQSMCDRRWGSRTLIRSWAGGGGGARSGAVPFPLLYKALDRWECLIGFWRRIGSEETPTPPLLFFEWGPSFITGYKVSPALKVGSYDVRKTPFLWMGLSRKGEPVGFLCNGSRYQSEDDLLKLSSLGLEFSDPELVPVTVNFSGENYFILRESGDLYPNGVGGSELGGDEDLMSASPPDRLMSEIYQYFANRTSTGADKASRRHRKKERERLGRRRLINEHFVKITDCCPTPSRPLQGLWKGICQNLSLVFYLLMYDDIGGIVCRRVGDSSQLSSGYAPIFRTSETRFLEFPFPREEEEIYDNREHIQPVNFGRNSMEREVVSRILTINSTYGLVLPDLPGLPGDDHIVEGRIWEYKSGTFGFGFLQNNFIIDLKHIAVNGSLLDAVEYCSDTSNS